MLELLMLGAIAVAPEAKCSVTSVRNGVTVIAYLGDRKCVAWKPRRTFHGIYVDCTEGQAYYDGARSLEEVKARKEHAWFSTDDVTRFTVAIPSPRYHCEAYRVTFVGREAQDMHRAPGQGYGHFNMTPGVVLVDDLTSLTDIGPGLP
jgi:hypothetical protein